MHFVYAGATLVAEPQQKGGAMKALTRMFVAIVVMVTAGVADAKSPPNFELFDINNLDSVQEAKLISHVETQARLIFGEYFLRVELMPLTIKQEGKGKLHLPGQAPKDGTFESLVKTRAIMIFYVPLPPPRDPMPVGVVREKLSQPFIWPDGRTAQMKFGHNKPMSSDELGVVNQNSESPSAPQESKIGLLPIFIELTREASRQAA
ncbi:MAG: hypothetical protein EXS68_02955 [Candidatus Ryanbacteria bacterium]|nr:hypothetical protein [Candidatus Ryanbacteria bacterium]